jgi:hypothetical protein
MNVGIVGLACARTSYGSSVAYGRGAYGLRLRGFEEFHELLRLAGPDWLPLALRAQVGHADPREQWVRRDGALLRLRSGGQVEIDWVGGTATFTVPHAVRQEDLLHPYLAPVAAMAAYRDGREGFHGGAVLAGSVAWVVLGDKEAGKSSLLAQLALRGHVVVADDVVILDERGCALAGPRFIDLRGEAAARPPVREPHHDPRALAPAVAA